MATVWATFLVTGVALLALAIVGLRWRGDKGRVFQTVGRFLLVLAAVTALFPSVLASLGPARWAAVYVGFVVSLTAVMTTVAVARARALKS
jgi:hypothetical protein